MSKKSIVAASKENLKIVTNNIDSICKYKLYQSRTEGRKSRIINKIDIVNKEIKDEQNKIKKLDKEYNIYSKDLEKLRKYFLKISKKFYQNQLNDEELTIKERKQLEEDFLNEIRDIDEVIIFIQTKLNENDDKYTISQEKLSELKEERKSYIHCLKVLKKYLKLLKQRISCGQTNITDSTKELGEFYLKVIPGQKKSITK